MCAQCSIEPQGPKILRRSRKEGAKVGRPGRFRFGGSRSLKNFVAQPNKNIRAARPQCSTIRSSCGDRTPQDGRRGTWTARFTCAQCSIEPQGPKTLRRGRKEGAGVARFRRFRFGWVMEPKNSLAWSNEDARTARSGRSGRAVEKRLHGTVEEGAQAARRRCSRISIEPQGLKTLRRGRKRVREPQGSRALKPIDP
jgi:hypothetical protein